MFTVPPTCKAGECTRCVSQGQDANTTLRKEFVIPVPDRCVPERGVCPMVCAPDGWVYARQWCVRLTGVNVSDMGV